MNEATTNPPDDPAVATSIAVTTAGATVSGIDIQLNALSSPGAIDDNSLQVFLFDGNTPGANETLILDDDDLDNVFGLTGSGQLAWVSRFTPASYPYRIEGMEIFFFDDPSISAGRSIQLLILTDSGGTGDPDNATLDHTQNTTITSLNAFNPYTFTSQPTITSGDFYIGVYDLDADTDGTFIASRRPGHDRRQHHLHFARRPLATEQLRFDGGLRRFRPHLDDPRRGQPRSPRRERSS